MNKEAPTNGTTPRQNQEFPDIQEIEDEESSDSEDDSPMGFEDNFSKSPQKAVERDAIGAESPEPASAIPGHLQPPQPGLERASSTASSLPDFEQQTAPPTYQSAVPDDNPNPFPREYKNLLPERDSTISPPADSAVSTIPQSPPSYGPEVGHAQNQDDDTRHSPVPPLKMSPFDFDSAFAGVGPAQVEEDSDDEDDAYRSSKAPEPDFDATFDTPVQSRESTAASNLPPSAQANGSPQPPPKDNFFGFYQSPPAPPATSA
ncbi:MAG: hypothetical protein M1823_007070, partial [Watsoniomyces obsoletus]